MKLARRTRHPDPRIRLVLSGNYVVPPKRCTLAPVVPVYEAGARIRNGHFKLTHDGGTKSKQETYTGVFTPAPHIRLKETRFGTKFGSNRKCNVSGTIVLKYRKKAPPPGPSA